MPGKSTSTIPNSKANFQYFDMKNILKDWKPNIKDNVILVIFIAAFCAGIGICFYYGVFDGLTALWATVGGIIAGFVFYGWGQYNNKFFTGSNARFAMIAYLITASATTIAIMLVMNVLYDCSILAVFSSDWLVQVYWLLGLLYGCYLSIASLELWRHIQTKAESKIIMDLSLMIIPALALLIVMFNLVPASTPAGTYYWGLTIVAVPLFCVYVFTTWRRNKTASNWEVIRQLLVLYGVALAVSLIVILFAVDPFGWNLFGGKIAGHIPLVPGQGTTTNYFSYIFYIFFQSPTAAIMIAIMTFGTVVNIFASTLGSLTRGAVVIGVIITVVPPMIIILEIFSGGIPPPDLLSDLLGVGVASFIFALCETGVFVIIAIILSVFSGVADLLTSKSSASLG